MSDTLAITATIKNATFHMNGMKQYCRGNIYDDVRGRFADGESICTSSIEDIRGNVIITRNSTYRIERSIRS